MIRTRTLVAAAALVLAACSGSDAAGGEDTPPDTADVTSTTESTAAPETTVADTTEPDTTAPDTTAPDTGESETTAPDTTAPESSEPEPADLGPFCDAGEQYLVTVWALAESDTVTSPAGGEALIGLAIADADAAEAVAPDAAFAAEAAEAATALRELEQAFAAVDYDVELADPAVIIGGLETVETNYGRLELFLEDQCGADLADISVRSEALAASIQAQYPDDPDPDPDPDPGSAEPIEVTDDSELLFARVPGSWVDVDGTAEGDIRQLIAAPDIAAFLASFVEPGLYLGSGDGPSLAANAFAEGFREEALAAGCTVSVSTPYDDGLYDGEEELFDCPGGDSTLHLIRGSNGEDDVWFFIALIVEGADATTRDLVADSFFVD